MSRRCEVGALPVDVRDWNFPATLNQGQGNFWYLPRKKQWGLEFTYFAVVAQIVRKNNLVHLL